MDPDKRLKLAAQVHPAAGFLSWQLLADCRAGHRLWLVSLEPGLTSLPTGLLHALQIAKDVVNRAACCSALSALPGLSRRVPACAVHSPQDMPVS